VEEEEAAEVADSVRFDDGSVSRGDFKFSNSRHPIASRESSGPLFGR
jgi:hypothetical protein